MNKGKRVTNIFLNLESPRKKKSCIRKLCKVNEEHILFIPRFIINLSRRRIVPL